MFLKFKIFSIIFSIFEFIRSILVFQFESTPWTILFISFSTFFRLSSASATSRFRFLLPSKKVRDGKVRCRREVVGRGEGNKRQETHQSSVHPADIDVGLSKSFLLHLSFLHYISSPQKPSQKLICHQFLSVFFLHKYQYKECN